MPPLSGSWAQALKGEFHKEYYRQLFETVGKEYQTRKVFPPADDIFNAFHLTPLDQVKVVILGQDPYHGDGQAHGLCFSVKPEVEIPPSLVNIYKELEDDLGCYVPNNGYLEKWAKQGVLMLNTVLTVRAHQANSPPGNRMGAVHRRCDSGFGRTRSADGFHSVGETCADEESHASQSETSDSGSTASQSARHTAAFSKPSIFKGESVSEQNGLEPIDWQIENI